MQGLPSAAAATGLPASRAAARADGPGWGAGRLAGPSASRFRFAGPFADPFADPLVDPGAGGSAARLALRVACIAVGAALAASLPAAAAPCELPGTRADRLALLAPMAGFAEASGTTGGLEHGLFAFETLDDSAPARSPAPGTLRAAVEAARAAGGGWITPTPQVPAEAEIRLAAPLRLPANTTIDGGCQGVRLVAPPRGAALLVIGSRNVVVTRWQMRAPRENLVSDRPGDCLGIGGGADRVWVAFNRFGRCGDGQVDITQSTTLATPTRVTVAHNHFTNHDKVMLVATLDCGQRLPPVTAVCPAPLRPDWSWDNGVQVTLQANLFEGTGQRHPRVSGRAFVHALDNLVAYRRYRREDGSLGPGYGVLVGGGGRVLLDHGLFQPADGRSGWAARTQQPGRGSSSEKEGALSIQGARAPVAAEFQGFATDMVPEPPYALRGGWAPDPAAAGLVEAMRRCTGPQALPSGAMFDRPDGSASPVSTFAAGCALAAAETGGADPPFRDSRPDPRSADPAAADPTAP